MVIHHWGVRGECPTCGDVFWTTNSPASVVCSCGGCGINNDVLDADALPITDEYYFKQMVGEATGLDSDTLSIERL